MSRQRFHLHGAKIGAPGLAGAPRGEKTGADFRVDNLLVPGNGDKSAGIIAWCLRPDRDVPEQLAGRGRQVGHVEVKVLRKELFTQPGVLGALGLVEADKISGNKCLAVAARNGHEFHGGP